MPDFEGGESALSSPDEVTLNAPDLVVEESVVLSDDTTSNPYLQAAQAVSTPAHSHTDATSSLAYTDALGVESHVGQNEADTHDIANHDHDMASFQDSHDDTAHHEETIDNDVADHELHDDLAHGDDLHHDDMGHHGM